MEKAKPKMIVVQEIEQTYSSPLSLESVEIEPSKTNETRKKTSFSLSNHVREFGARFANKVLYESCFPINNSRANELLIFFTLSSLAWLFAYIALGRNALPGGLAFSLIILIVSAHVAGYLVELIKMPSLLGMLLVGVFFQNVPVLCIVGQSIDSTTSSLLRNTSFCFILCRAGLSLDLKSLTKDKWKISTLSFLPCLTEAIGFGICAKFMLNIPFEWSILMGFVVSGVSPAVVVPIMIDLKTKKLGESKNVPSVIIAASCLDNIVAITGVTLLIGIIFNTGAIWLTIILCPVQILLGVVYGILVAFFLNIIRINHTLHLTTLRFIILTLFSLIVLIGSKAINYTTAGPLGVLTLTILAKRIWENVDKFTANGDGTIDINELIAKNSATVAAVFNQFWRLIFLPLLFGLIGNEVNFQKINLSFIGYGVALVVIGVLLRLTATFISVMYKAFTHKERLFFALSWLPKATVQAAVGSLALDLARSNQNADQILLGTQVLNIAVLSIVLTAPLGTLLISLMAPRLLKSLNNDNVLVIRL